MEKGEANCKDLIEAHKKCMRELGFNVWEAVKVYKIYKFNLIIFRLF